jgi:uncharacterized protein (DUF885 family)
LDLERAAAEIEAAQGRLAERERLRALFDATWRYQMEEFPEMATFTGHPGQDHRWTDLSLLAVERRRREIEIPARVLSTIDRSRLAPEDQLDHDVFQREVQEAVDGRRFRGELMPLSQMNGVQQDVAQMLAMMPTGTVAHYENVLARLEAVPALVDQTVVLMKEGLATGLTPPRVTLRDVPQQVRNQIVDDPRQSPLLRAFARFPDSIPGAERERLAARAAAAYTVHVAPAYRRLYEFLVGTYIPAARETIALRALPDGEAWYSWSVRQYTTTTLGPDAIHATGLAEVERIRSGMDAAIAATGFDGSFHDFARFLRTDPRFYYEKADDLVTGYRDICKRADPELVRLFGRLPRLPYGVKPVPAYAEKSQTTAYYEPGSPAAGRPGYFFANTYDLASRPRWEMEALALHEAVPGHHLQIALAQEMEGVPDFRRHGRFTAFVEGWGLYAEGLGAEMGFYEDPYALFGRLSYEMWRAIRLVVDTGMHWLGWSRQQAIDYFKDNSGKAEHDIIVEVDRYIVWPGQALAYKIGEMKILQLRARAARELGPGFDLRRFHDLVLGAGALPLDVLEDRVARWIGGGGPPAP